MDKPISASKLLINTLLRLSYAAFREGLWPKGTIQIHVIDAAGESRELCNEFDVLRLIYTQKVRNPLEFKWTASDNQPARPIASLHHFFEELILPFLDKGILETYSTFLEKVRASMETEQRLHKARTDLEERIVDGNLGNMWTWIQQHIHSLKDGLLLMQFASLRGNPTHPLTKLRRGFSPDEVIAYSPEYGKAIQLPVLAVARGMCKITRQYQSLFPKEWFQKVFPQEFESWKSSLAQAGKEEIHYLPFPIHPFQWPFIRERFSESLSAGLIIKLPNVHIPAQATMSVRTLMPTESGKPYIKLPLNIQTTSMVRTHSPPRVHAGPLLSRMIERILAKDPELSSHVRIIPEPIGIYIDDASYFQQSQNPSYFLNVLYRENPSHLIGQEEIHLPLSAIFEQSPFSQQLLLLDILEANGVSRPEEAWAYFTDYAWKVIRAQVGLYAGYGIALEGHQQNTWLVLDPKGKLKFTLVGDLAGGVEIYQALLAMTGSDLQEDLHPVQKHMFSEGEIPEQQILHTTFNYHLIPIAIILSESFGLGFEDFLKSMAEMIGMTLDFYRKNTRHIVVPSDIPLYLQELDRIEQVFLSEEIQVRSLLRMGLANTQKNIYTQSANPFDQIHTE